jgi:hypothetical protein
VTLRIRCSASTHRVAFALSGELHGSDIAGLDALLEREAPGGVVLDLAELTLASRDGVDFIRRAVAGGAEVVNCPRYIRRWVIEGRDSGDDGAAR